MTGLLRISDGAYTMILTNNWHYNNEEFILDHYHTSEGHATVIRHAFSAHQLPPIYLKDLMSSQRKGLKAQLVAQLSEVLRANGVAPQPALQQSSGIKKAGKPRWTDAKSGTLPGRL